jgi:hypothetical protein
MKPTLINTSKRTKAYLVPNEKQNKLQYNLCIECAEPADQVILCFMLNMHHIDQFDFEIQLEDKSIESICSVKQEVLIDKMLVQIDISFSKIIQPSKNLHLANLSFNGENIELLNLKTLLNKDINQLEIQIFDQDINPVLSFEARSKIIFAQPNAFDETILCRFRIQEEGEAVIRLHNMIGQQVYESEIKYHETGDYLLEIPSCQLDDGLYICSLTQNTKHCCSLLLDVNKNTNIVS